MQFFNFVNEETYHFFTWVIGEGGQEPPALVKKAYEQVANDRWFEMGVDVSTVMKDKLGDLLEEQLCELLAVGNLEDFASQGLCVCSNEEVRLRSNLDSLTRSLLGLALNQIYFEVVAEAILGREGKWNPDKHRPKYI